MTEEYVVLVTVPSRESGEEIATRLLEERLAACVNLVGPVRSVYRWQGEVCRDDEILLLIKTCRARYESLEDLIGKLHPYEVPEIIALPIERGSASYLTWLRGQVSPS